MGLNKEEQSLLNLLLKKSGGGAVAEKKPKVKLAKLVVARVERALGDSRCVVLVRSKEGRVSTWSLESYMAKVQYGQTVAKKNLRNHLEDDRAKAPPLP